MRLHRRASSSRSPRRSCDNSGRERTTAFCYAVGWTQHTVGVQYIRTAAILQLLLGNIGRPGRRHPGAARPRVDPGLDRHPDALRHPARLHPDAARGAVRGPRRTTSSRTRRRRGFWGNFGALRRQPAEGVVGRARDRRERLLLRLPAADRPGPLDLQVRRSTCSTARSRASSSSARTRPSARRTRSCSGSRWRSSTGSSCATSSRSRRASFWNDGPEIETGELRTEEIATEVFFLPGGRARREGRHVHEHAAAAAVALRRRSSRRATAAPTSGSTTTSAAGSASSSPRSTEQRDRPMLELTWDYPTDGRARRAERRGRARRDQRLRTPTASRSRRYTELQGRRLDRVRLLDLLRRLRRRRQPGGAAQAAAGSRDWVALRVGLGVAGEPADPLQPRLGRPAASRGRSASATSGGTTEQRSGRATTCPTSTSEKPPDYVPPDGRERPGRRSPATTRSSCRPTDAAGSSRPPASSTGRCPTHYEPHESPVANPLYGQRANPARQRLRARARTRYQPGRPPERRYPYVVTTYRLTEHHTAGGMSPLGRRTSPSCSRRCSARSPRSSRGCAGSSTAAGRRSSRARAAIEARVLVTDRMRPLRVDGRVVHQVGLPYHWGSKGLTTGDAVERPVPARRSTRTSHIQEVKAFTVRHPARPPAARAGAAGARRARAARRGITASTGTSAVSERRGRLLHRHVGLHRLQGVRGGVQGVEPRPRGRPRLDGRVVRQHGRARRRTPGATSRSSSRTRRSGSTASRRELDRREPAPLADELGRLQALHARRLPRRLPDRRALPHRVRHRRRAGGRLQRLRLLRAGVPVRRDRPARAATAPRREARRPRLEVHALLRPARRTATSRRARRRARPTRSSSARSTSCASAPPTRVEKLQGEGWNGARLYGERPGRRRRRLRRVLPAARRARGVRPAARPGRDDARPAARCGATAALAAARARRAACSRARVGVAGR